MDPVIQFTRVLEANKYLVTLCKLVFTQMGMVLEGDGWSRTAPGWYLNRLSSYWGEGENRTALSLFPVFPRLASRANFFSSNFHQEACWQASLRKTHLFENVLGKTCAAKLRCLPSREVTVFEKFRFRCPHVGNRSVKDKLPRCRAFSMPFSSLSCWRKPYLQKKVSHSTETRPSLLTL